MLIIVGGKLFFTSQLCSSQIQNITSLSLFCCYFHGGWWYKIYSLVAPIQIRPSHLGPTKPHTPLHVPLVRRNLQSAFSSEQLHKELIVNIDKKRDKCYLSYIDSYYAPLTPCWYTFATDSFNNLLPWIPLGPCIGWTIGRNRKPLILNQTKCKEKHFADSWFRFPRDVKTYLTS